MGPNRLRQGSLALYRGVQVQIEELTGHDAAVIRAGESFREVKRNELMPVIAANAAKWHTELSDIDESAWSSARARAQAVNAILASDEDRTGEVRRQAAVLQVSERQLWRIIKGFKTHRSTKGLLAQPPGRPLGTQVLRTEVEKVISELYYSYYLAPERPTVQALSERVAAECRRQDLPAPTRQTVGRRVVALRGRATETRRVGSKAAKYEFQPMPGHLSAASPLSFVEIDHSPLDVMARSDDPYCAYVGRPWVTLAIDVFSRCILGYYLSFEPPSIVATALCLTHAVLPKLDGDVPAGLTWPMHGLPQEILTDNGRDFTSRAFQRGCDEHGIVLKYRPVGSPHYGGAIERLVGTVMGQCHLLPGTTKNSSRARGNYDSKRKATLTLSQCRVWMVEQILGRYHLKEHRMLRMPPALKWVEGMENGHDSF